mgnify:CR=1 FL=1
MPGHVAILGLGPSLEQYVNIVKRLGSRQAYCDEVWGINAVASVISCDRMIHMDDVRIQEIRAAARPESNIAHMLRWIKESPIPVVTSREHPDYPALVPFPLEAVLNQFRQAYFNSTAAYAVALALHLGVERLSIYGCDYTYPNAHDAERGRACMEFWLGIAVSKGVRLTIPKVSSLMDAMYSQADKLYGYDTVDVGITAEGQAFRVEFTERDSRPTADEIEARYDHNVHPNALVGN